MTDITELAQREKFEAWFKSSFHPDKTGPYIKDQLYFTWKAAGAELVEALEKAQKSIDSQREYYEGVIADGGKRIAELEPIRAAAEKLVRCKGRYHSEQNYRALAAMFGVTTPDLAPLDGEPVGEVIEVGDALLVEWHKNLEEGAKLYTALQAPIMPFGLHPDTQKLVTDFCTALAEKLYKAQLKYGYDTDWKQDGWPSQCQAHFHQHIAKGDPRDVAAYCAFMWWHGWSTKPAEGLESRTVTVKLPKPHAHLIWIQAGHAPDDYWDAVAVSHSEKDRCCDGSERYPVYAHWEIEEALTTAGIKLEVE